MNQSYAAALAFVLESEGGFSDDKNDSGGPTLHGITWGELAQYRRVHGTLAQPTATHAQQIALIKSLTPAEQADIYKRQYWDAVDGDLLPAPIDTIIFDAAVNMGVGTAIRMLDEAVQLPLHLAPDAALIQRLKDKQTKGKIPQVDADLFTERIARYHAIVAARPKDSVFLKGWLNRVASLRKEVSH